MADLTQVNQNKKDEVKEFEEDIMDGLSNIKSQDTFVLPSRGLIYNGGKPQSVTLRRMTVKEDRIRMRNESETKIRKDILQACAVDGTDISTLALFDANYLLFCLRRLSLLDDKYKVIVRCPQCGNEFIDELNLSKLKVNYMNADNLPNLDIVLPISKTKVRLKFPTLGNTILFGDSISEFLKNNADENITEILYAYGDTVYIDAINGNKVIFEEIEDFIDNLDLVDSKFLKKEIKKLDSVYGFDENIKCQCPSCKKEVEHGLPITSELFSPSEN